MTKKSESEHNVNCPWCKNQFQVHVISYEPTIEGVSRPVHPISQQQSQQQEDTDDERKE